MSEDIFQTKFNIPTDIYVVAPGPNGLAHIERIPDDAFIIVVNKAIELPLKPMLWLCAEPTVAKTDWFKENYDVNKHIACFWKEYLGESYPGIAYYWNKEEPVLLEHHWHPIPFVLRRRATITGQAVQLAYWLGRPEPLLTPPPPPLVKRIILCGFDAKGNTYYDDTFAGEGESLKLRAREWYWVTGFMNRIVKWMEENGTKVDSLSKTVLDVEVI